MSTILAWVLPLLRPSFWFNQTYLPFLPFVERLLPIALAAILADGVGMFAFGRYAKGLDKDKRMFFRKASTCSLLAGGVGLLLYFFHWQRIPILTMRILWVLWAAGFGTWAFLIWKEFFRLLPAQKTQAAEREAYEKWLPKPKG